MTGARAFSTTSRRPASPGTVPTPGGTGLFAGPRGSGSWYGTFPAGRHARGRSSQAARTNRGDTSKARPPFRSAIRTQPDHRGPPGPTRGSTRATHAPKQVAAAHQQWRQPRVAEQVVQEAGLPSRITAGGNARHGRPAAELLAPSAGSAGAFLGVRTHATLGQTPAGHRPASIPGGSDFPAVRPATDVIARIPRRAAARLSLRAVGIARNKPGGWPRAVSVDYVQENASPRQRHAVLHRPDFPIHALSAQLPGGSLS